MYPTTCYTMETVQTETSSNSKNRFYYFPEAEFFYLEINKTNFFIALTWVSFEHICLIPINCHNLKRILLIMNNLQFHVIMLSDDK